MFSDTRDSSLSVSLDRVLEYDNRDLVLRFMSRYEVSVGEAEEIFVDLKYFLYFCSVFPESSIERSMVIVDCMWHEFILMTREYRRFCEDYFGQFIDHTPVTESEKLLRRSAWVSDSRQLSQSYRERIETLVGKVYELLGEQVAIRWFRELDWQFPPERMKSIQKPLI